MHHARRTPGRPGQGQGTARRREQPVGRRPQHDPCDGRLPRRPRSFLGVQQALGTASCRRQVREQLVARRRRGQRLRLLRLGPVPSVPDAGLTDADLLDRPLGPGGGPEDRRALKFARTLVENRGKVTDADLRAVREAGFGDAEIAEIVAHVGLEHASPTTSTTSPARPRLPQGPGPWPREVIGVPGRPVLRAGPRLTEEQPMRQYPSDIAFTPAVKARPDGERFAGRVRQGRAEPGLADPCNARTGGVPGRAGHVLPRHGQRRGPAVHPVPGRPAGLPEGARRPDACVRRLRRQPPVHHPRQPVGEPEGVHLPDGLRQPASGSSCGARPGWSRTTPPCSSGSATRSTRARSSGPIVFTIEAWDINCPQHIHRRFSEQQVGPVIEQLQAAHRRVGATTRRTAGSRDLTGAPRKPEP